MLSACEGVEHPVGEEIYAGVGEIGVDWLFRHSGHAAGVIRNVEHGVRH